MLSLIHSALRPSWRTFNIRRYKVNARLTEWQADEQAIAHAADYVLQHGLGPNLDPLAIILDGDQVVECSDSLITDVVEEDHQAPRQLGLGNADMIAASCTGTDGIFNLLALWGPSDSDRTSGFRERHTCSTASRKLSTSSGALRTSSMYCAPAAMTTHPSTLATLKTPGLYCSRVRS